MLWLLLGLALQEAAPPLPSEAERRGALLASLVEAGDPAAVAYTLHELQRGGLPPVVLAAFLEAAKTHPRLAFREPIEQLCRYRSVGIRVRALLALAALPGHGARAAWWAMEDAEPRIRRLGLLLAERHTNPALEEAALRLRDREPGLVP